MEVLTTFIIIPTQQHLWYTESEDKKWFLAQPFFFRQFSESELVAWAKWLIVRLLEQPNWRFCDDTLLGPFLKQNLKSLSLSVQFDIITPQPSHCNVLLYISVQLYIKVNTKSCPHASYCIVFL